LLLSHLFRKRGPEVSIQEAVDLLSFCWRYAPPSDIRKMLSLALQNEMIKRQGDMIHAEFVYGNQFLPPNLQSDLGGRLRVDGEASPLY
jgi:hypothetical protein